MKKKYRIISLGLVLCLLALSLCGCQLFAPKSDEELIRERVKDFETALNTGDIDEALECLDAKSRNAYNAAFNIGESILGYFIGFNIDMSDMFALAIGLNGGDMYSMKVYKVSITSDTTATVYLTATIQMYGEMETEDTTLDMVKEKGGWYISAQADWSSLMF